MNTALRLKMLSMQKKWPVVPGGLAIARALWAGAGHVTGWESREPYFPWQKKLSQLLGDYKTLMKWDAA